LKEVSIKFIGILSLSMKLRCHFCLGYRSLPKLVSLPWLDFLSPFFFSSVLMD
jgi:hypothetical protein